VSIRRSPRCALILPRTLDAELAAEEALTDLAAAVPFDRAAFCRVSGPREIEVLAVRPTQAAHPPAGTFVALADVLGGEAVRAGLPVEVDLATSPLSFDQTLAAAGFRYVLRIPVARGGVAAAAIAVLRRAERFDDAEIKAVARIAGRVVDRVLPLTRPIAAPSAARAAARPAQIGRAGSASSAN
jgi:hypothetical protein